MRIGFVVPGFSRDSQHWAIPALQTYILRLAQTHQVVVFSLRYPETGEYRFAGLTHVAIGGGHRAGVSAWRIRVQGAQAIALEHRRQPFDLLHAFWVDEPAWVAGLAGRWLGLPVVASAAGGELLYLPDIDYGMQKSWGRRLLIRQALNWATQVTAGSKYQLSLAAALGVPQTKLNLAPFGVDRTKFVPANTVPEKPWRIIQAASLVPVKDPVLLLTVLRQLQTAVGPCQLILVGDGPMAAELQQVADAYQLQDQIVWAGQRSFVTMPKLYQKAHLYLQTSRHEAQGMAVLEALACGLPVVGTPVGVVPEVGVMAATVDGLVTAVAETLGQRGMLPERYGLPQAQMQFEQLYTPYLTAA